MPSKTKRKRVVTDSEEESDETSKGELGSGTNRRKRKLGNGMSHAATNSKAAGVRSSKRNMADSRDIDYEKESDVKSKRRKKKVVDAASKATSDPIPDEEEEPSPRLRGFVTEEEMDTYARNLRLKRLSLDDLNHCNSLNDCYTGGQVLSHCSTSYGNLDIFVQDETAPELSQSKHLKISFSDPLAASIPSLDGNAKLFVHKASIEIEKTDFSQDHTKCLVVEDSESKVWIVHKDIRNPTFFSRTSCGKNWWKRTSQRRKKLQCKW